MPRSVLDTTILVSAFLRLNQGGPASELLQLAAEGRFELYLAEPILDELRRVLLTRQHLRRRYQYDDASALAFVDGIGELATIITDLPDVTVVRDPADDMIVACGLAAEADYIVTRDKDLLSLGRHKSIEMITPEAFLQVLRASP